MTPTELRKLCDEADALCEKATPGPWEPGGPYPSVSVIVCIDSGGGQHGECPEPPMYEPICSLHQAADFDKAPPTVSVNDAEFIARSRTLVPQLTAALREAAGEIERLRIKAGELTPADRQSDCGIFDWSD